MSDPPLRWKSDICLSLVASSVIFSKIQINIYKLHEL